MVDLEAEACSVAVTPISVTLTIRTLTGAALTMTMPRDMGERLAVELRFGLEAVGRGRETARAGSE